MILKLTNFFKNRQHVLLTTIIAFASTQLNAQFVQQSFDQPQSRFELLRKQGSDNINTLFVEASEVPTDSLGPEFIGNASIKFLPYNQSQNLCIALPEYISRSQIAEAGSVVYSADVYLPSKDVVMPTSSLAVIGMNSSSSYAMYRFGITDNAKELYFSFTDGIDPGSKIYQKEPTEKFNLRQPGWNRLQVMVTAKGIIVCAVNGKETTFSPLLETTLDDLGVGFSVNSSSSNTPVYVDNFSITPNKNLILSAFPGSGAQAQGNSSAPQVQTQTTSPQTPTPVQNSTTSINWQEDPSAAWKVAKDQNNSLIILFTNSTFPSHKYFLNMMEETSELKTLLAGNTVALLDVNKQPNQDHALKFKVYQFPTLLILDQNGSEKDKTTLYVDQSTAGSVTEWLKNALE